MAGKPNDSNNKMIHAMVITTKDVIDLVGKDLYEHFTKFKVSLINVSPASGYGPEAISLVLTGKEKDIRKSLNQLKKLCLQKELGVEKTPIHSLPPAYRGYLNDIEDNIRFEKLFSYCSKEYLEYCKQTNVKPHPEVLEAVVSQ